jgi:hypothetical protein
MAYISILYKIVYTASLWRPFFSTVLVDAGIEPRDGIFKLYGAEKSIPPAYLSWRAGTKTLFLLGS